MKNAMRLEHEFVDRFPEVLQDGALYISIESSAIGHKCCCGCGEEVIVSLTPASWRFTYDGENVSIWPSIGSHSLACRSHYVIDKSLVKWCRPWTDEEARLGREQETQRAAQYYESKLKPASSIAPETVPSPTKDDKSQDRKPRGWDVVKRLFKK